MENNQPNNESRVQLEKVKQDEAFFESETVLQETSDADAQIITLPGRLRPERMRSGTMRLERIVAQFSISRTGQATEYGDW